MAGREDEVKLIPIDDRRTNSPDVLSPMSAHENSNPLIAILNVPEVLKPEVTSETVSS